jgi:Zn-dependent protease
MVTIARLVGLIGGLLLGMVLHEYAHARVSDTLGDRTPRFSGRLTLNPMRHLDPIGSIAIPGVFVLTSLVGQPFGMLFGYAKPVPTTPSRLRNPRRDQVLVALAGPATNLLLAVVAGALFKTFLPPEAVFFPTGGIADALAYATTVNVFLMIINALPIPPLDGSRVLGLFLSRQAQYKLLEWGQYLLLFVILLFFIFRGVLGAMADPVCRVFTGLGGCAF